MTKHGNIQAYNKYEAEVAANDQRQVLGKLFFTHVVSGANNFIGSEKYSNLTGDLDEIVDYVFSYQIKPTAASLRQLANNTAINQYLIVVLNS